MGINHSRSKISKEEKERRGEIKVQLVKNKIANIEALQKQAILAEASTNATSTVNTEFSKVIQISETAKHQLQRGGANLTKADLIAIILRLGAHSDVPSLDNLQSLTMGDLIVMIRLLIYDPVVISLDYKRKEPVDPGYYLRLK